MKKELFDILKASLALLVVLIVANLYYDIDKVYSIVIFCQISSLNIILKVMEKQIFSSSQKVIVIITVLIIAISTMLLINQQDGILLYLVASAIIAIIYLINFWFRNRK